MATKLSQPMIKALTFAIFSEDNELPKRMDGMTRKALKTRGLVSFDNVVASSGFEALAQQADMEWFAQAWSLYNRFQNSMALSGKIEQVCRRACRSTDAHDEVVADDTIGRMVTLRYHQNHLACCVAMANRAQITWTDVVDMLS